PDVPQGAVALSPRRVSSVLNRDVKQFGKQHLFDGSEETCWNSDQVGGQGQGTQRLSHPVPPLTLLSSTQGTSQWVTLDFPRPVKVSELHIQFQGGFSSRLCTLEGCRTGEELVKISELYPQDSHAMQISFPRMMTGFQVEETVLDKLKITFGSSTDFFGRVVVYHLGVLGERL
ncbi:NR2CA protein, partial [Phainopepla nitens]|nr:NR2CA protein [Phainopepla nitens]